MGQEARKVIFVGTHPKLVTGRYYNSREYAEASGCSIGRITARLYRYGKITDELLLPPMPLPVPPRLETESEIMMDKWLRKPIINRSTEV
jgi:hypothetical protein|tara:strand:+ start:203 stop:472 length:270 start_codon:yes stop_codon:yes gene_type:complete